MWQMIISFPSDWAFFFSSRCAPILFPNFLSLTSRSSVQMKNGRCVDSSASKTYSPFRYSCIFSWIKRWIGTKEQRFNDCNIILLDSIILYLSLSITSKWIFYHQKTEEDEGRIEKLFDDEWNNNIMKKECDAMEYQGRW